jgi:ribonuclease HI
MKQIEIYVNVACPSNPGPSGWAAILKYKKEKSLLGYMPHSTNNRILLIAVINALEKLTEPCAVRLYCNATYITDFIKRPWYEKLTEQGINIEQSIKHNDLWKKLLGLMEIHRVSYVHIKNGENDTYLRECKRLAKKAIKQAG